MCIPNAEMESYNSTDGHRKISKTTPGDTKNCHRQVTTKITTLL
jgi:hypothetical protein